MHIHFERKESFKLDTVLNLRKMISTKHHLISHNRFLNQLTERQNN